MTAPTTSSPIPDQADGEHLFASDELFFSTTDEAGCIQRANSTFMRLSGYPRGSLVGRAHNVVRHPDMPAGLFRGMWEDLEAGLAVSAYITNRSSDGGCYRVFATIIPSSSGYLSVRTLPMLTGLRGDMEAAYARVRAVEEESAASGSNRREAAAAGQAALLAELRALGYRDTVDFTDQVLPAEMAALVASGVDIPERPDAVGPVGVILDAMNDIEARTGALVGLLDEYARLVALLGWRAAEIDDLSARLGQLRDALRQVEEEVTRTGEAQDVEDVTERRATVDALVLECFEQLKPLHGQVEELRGDVNAVRFSIALARLHNLMAGFFALQLLEGADQIDANDAVGALGDLTTALHDGAAALTRRLAVVDARADVVGGELEVVASSLTATHRPLLELLAVAAEAGAADAGSVRTARSLVRDGFEEARDLADLAGSCRAIKVPYDAEQIDTRLGQVRAALTELDTSVANDGAGAVQ